MWPRRVERFHFPQSERCVAFFLLKWESCKLKSLLLLLPPSFSLIDSFHLKSNCLKYATRRVQYVSKSSRSGSGKSKSILAISQKSKTLNKSCPQRHVGALVLGKLLQFFSLAASWHVSQLVRLLVMDFHDFRVDVARKTTGTDTNRILWVSRFVGKQVDMQREERLPKK